MMINSSSPSSSISSSHLIPLEFKSLHTLPDSHTWPPPHHHHPSSHGAVPVIDLSDPNATFQIRRACEKWGLFQVINHGISQGLIKQAEHQTRRLFALPRDKKLRALRSPDGLTGYGSPRISKNFPKLMWSEGFSMMDSPVEHARLLWPRNHSNFCDIMEEYQKEMKGLATKMVGLMLESLGLTHEDVKWLKPHKRTTRFPQAVLHLNSYPACPDPNRAMGLAPHTDSSLLTLNQSTTSGLQVLVDGGSWVPVHPTPGALVVDVGDLMHILSNGRFKTAVHRAVVNKVHHRISIAYFYGPPRDVKVSPLMKLIERNHPPLYRPVTWKEYLRYKATHFNKALDLIRNTNGCNPTSLMDQQLYT